MAVMTSGLLTQGAYGSGRVGVRKWVEIEADQADAMHRVNLFKTTQLFEVFKQRFDFGYPKRTGEGAPGILDSRTQGYTGTFTPVELTLMYGITKLAEFTDQYGLYNGDKEAMASAFIDARSLAIANLHNNGFNTLYPGLDGVTLYNTAHPYKTYGTWSNRPVPEYGLSIDNLAKGISQMRKVKTARQRPIRYNKGLVLHCGPDLEDLGTRLINAKQQPQTTSLNEPKGSTKRILSIDIDEDLSSSTAWFLRAADISLTGLFFLRQMPFDIIQSATGTGGFDPWTRSKYTSMYESYIVSWLKAQAIWGTQGA